MRELPSGVTTKYLTAQEAADYLRIGVQTLAAWRARGIGPKYRRHGARRIVYSIDDLDKFSATMVEDRDNFPATIVK